MYPIPSNYKIKLIPSFNNFEFSGEEVIKFKVNTNTKEIEFDCVELVVSSCTESENIISSFTYNKESEKLKIMYSCELIAGKEYSIKILYNGIINNGLAGWYRSKYTYNNTEKYIATTQFEAADARRAIICVDHPSYKATFDISILIDSKFKAISNSTIKSDELIDKSKKLIEFNTTPKMSTYLLYFGVGEFEIIEDKYRDINIRGIATTGKSEYTKFAIECTQKFLKYFEEYFNINYPLPKVDLISIPDFAAGAMENWGAITFRETALLYYPASTPVTRQHHIAEVVAHELAHQWFGNLVTMKWWNDLWLNESFATFMANKALDFYWKEREIWTDYISSTVFTGMELDSLNSSHPIQVQVEKASDIDELFDEIAYDKGGSILRMLEAYIGEDNFKLGLQKYINKFKYSNAEGRDLWEILEQSSKMPVSSFMESFITQSGFPILKVEYENNILKISQSKFSLLNNLNNKQDSKLKWEIPLVISNNTKIIKRLLNTEQLSEKFNIEKDDKYININTHYSSFFITEYSIELLNKLSTSFTLLSSEDKLGILHDIHTLCISTKYPFNTYLSFIEKISPNESNLDVLNYIINTLYKSDSLLSLQSIKEIMITVSKKIILITTYLPSLDEKPSIAQARSTAIIILSKFKDEKTSFFIQDKFDSFLINKDSLESNIKTTVFACAVLLNDNNYHKILDLYLQDSSNQEEASKLLSALGYTKNLQLIKETLKFVTTDKVRFSYMNYAIYSISKNSNSKDILLDWIIGNWDYLSEKSAGMSSMILRGLLQSIIPTCGINNTDKVQNFINKAQKKGLEKTFDQVLEKLEIYIKFVKANM